MAMTDHLVFLTDVDNTLLDNDRFAVDLGQCLQRWLGASERDRYWEIFNQLRQQSGYADYLSAVQLLRVGLEDRPELLQLSAFVLDYPFAERLYPQALQTLAHLAGMATTVVLSDGDVIFQPRKIQRAGIWDAVAGRVIIDVHKELMLESMQQRYPADRYFMVDDKPNLLAAMKRVMGERLRTVFVRQGHYAHDADMTTIDPAPDSVIEHINELLDFDLARLQAI